MTVLPHLNNWQLCREHAHPVARDRLIQDWYFDCTDDNSPFGSDVGADILTFLSQQVAENPQLTGEAFLAAQLAEWELNPYWAAITDEAVAVILQEDFFGIATANEAAIAVAFGQLLMFGRIESLSRTRALQAIAREELPVLVAGWIEPEERRTRLGIMRDCLLATSDLD